MIGSRGNATFQGGRFPRSAVGERRLNVCRTIALGISHGAQTLMEAQQNVRLPLHQSVYTPLRFVVLPNVPDQLWFSLPTRGFRSGAVSALDSVYYK